MPLAFSKTEVQTNDGAPLITVIVPTFNEVWCISQTMRSILAQRTEGIAFEVLVVDGNSTDGTPEIVSQIASRDNRVRLLRNEKRSTPCALNIGLREARGAYICILGAHTKYTSDYIAVCFRELINREAGACGARVITEPANSSLQARLVAWALAHPFGSSRKSFRTQPEGYVDIVNYPLVLKQALLDAGGYDETLVRNEDNDMCQRLRAAGHKLFCTWKTHCSYYPVPSIRRLAQYAFRNGFWNALSFRRNPASMTIRYFVPCLFVITSISLLSISIIDWIYRWPRGYLLVASTALLIATYVSASVIAGIHSAVRHRCLAALLLPFVFLSFHVSYGCGTLYALLTNAKVGVAPPTF